MTNITEVTNSMIYDNIKYHMERQWYYKGPSSKDLENAKLENMKWVSFPGTSSCKYFKVPKDIPLENIDQKDYDGYWA